MSAATSGAADTRDGRLHVTQQRSRSLQSVCLTFPMGQRDELPGAEGVAHLVEHLFHCRGEVGASGLFESMQLRGINANAYTGADYLQFWAAIPPENLSEWAAEVAMRLLEPTWSGATIRRELAVIGHEVASKVENHPHRGFSFHHTRSALFSDHANRHAGFVNNKKLYDLDPEEIEAHFRRMLDPHSAILATVGPMSRDEAAHGLRAVTDHLVVGADEGHGPRAYQLGRSRRHVIKAAPQSPTGSALTFPVSCSRKQDWGHVLATHQLLATILAQMGDRSLVVGGDGLAVTARVGINTDAIEDRSPTCLTVSAVGPHGTQLDWFPDRVRTALTDREKMGELDRLEAARSYLLVGLARKVENGVSLARVTALTKLFASTTPERYAKCVEELTVDDITAAASRLSSHGGSEVTL